MRTPIVFAIAIAIALFGSPAAAQVASLGAIEVSNASGGDAFQGRITTDLEVDFSGQYSGSQLLLQLRSGEIYQDPAGTASPPNAVVVEALPGLAFDTFVAQGFPTSPGSFGDPSFAGGAVNLGGGGMADFGQTRINLAWHPAGGTLILDQHGFLVARITLSDDAAGDYAYLASAAGELREFSGVIRDGRFDIGVSLADCNGDGLVDLNDLACACAARDETLARLHLLAGDLNGDGQVAFADFLLLSANFGKAVDSYVDGDIDCDGQVAFADFLALSANFGASSSGVATVPEPTSMIWWAVLAALIVVRQQHFMRGDSNRPPLY